MEHEVDGWRDVGEQRLLQSWTVSEGGVLRDLKQDCFILSLYDHDSAWLIFEL